MPQRYFLKGLLLGAGLLAAGAVHAQQLAPDSVRHPHPLLFKAGLRLTHFRYAHDSKSWQFLLPLSLGAEFRVAPRLGFYTQLETDLSASSSSGRRRGAQANAVTAAGVALGVRYYYGHAARTASPFGRYLALEGSAEWEQLTDARWVTTSGSGRRRTTPAVLTPGVYALWGVQHRLRGHSWYDLSAGAGVLAPAYYNFERPASRWNVGGQATIRLFFGL
ncbi:hypothetical protein GCM10023172_05820 [Hymenobacter ginsengisoli]|uniref:Outer membrane protein beta-barrel domain-containing protein n=1 Tax=Hymenobacter ginsengisoli TaxID=1051626 RepID=A0ABP8Q1T5_9BACT|nr:MULTISPECIES: hypothetical protein [unclassified Hymenobacter]MBO2033904.1 hypothetical protein [Hymenobacter sp. BT559]